jgi:hypothetical protein
MNQNIKWSMIINTLDKNFKMSIFLKLQSVSKNPKSIEITYCLNLNALALSQTHECMKD